MHLLSTPVQTLNIRSDQSDQNSSLLMQMEAKKEKLSNNDIFLTNSLIPEIMPQVKSLAWMCLSSWIPSAEQRFSQNTHVFWAKFNRNSTPTYCKTNTPSAHRNYSNCYQNLAEICENQIEPILATMVTEHCAAHPEVSGCSRAVPVKKTTEFTRRCSVWRHSIVTQPSQPTQVDAELYSQLAQRSDKEQVYLLGWGELWFNSIN